MSSARFGARLEEPLQQERIETHVCGILPTYDKHILHETVCQQNSVVLSGFFGFCRTRRIKDADPDGVLCWLNNSVCSAAVAPGISIDPCAELARNFH